MGCPHSTCSGSASLPQRLATSSHLSENAPHMQQRTPLSTRLRIGASITPHADEVERKTGCFVPNNVLQLRMDLAVEILEILAAMADHRPGKSGERFCRNLDRAGNEKLIVRNHEQTFNVQPCCNVQHVNRGR